MQNNFSQLEAKCFGLFDEWANRFGANFTIALSGGGDSLALTLLAEKWRELKMKNARIFACVIDHGIADNSKYVAEIALERARNIGVAGSIFKLHEKIETRIQENARKLRYNALFECAKENQSKVILLGHNKDDQIETLLFRMCRKTGIDGLGGMNVLQNNYSHDFGSFYLARPLLDFSRGELREYLNFHRIKYFDDPANVSQKFARVKIREFIAKSPSLETNTLLKIAKEAQHLRSIFATIIRDYLSLNLATSAKGMVLRNFGSLSQELRHRVLETIIHSFNYPNYRPKREKIEKLLESGLQNARTLGGVKIQIKNNALIFTIAPPRKSQMCLAKFPNQKIFDAISNYCS